MRLFGILTEKERNLVNKAITQERERIIKLLEERYEGDEFVEEQIELIKGETNE